MSPTALKILTDVTYNHKAPLLCKEENRVDTPGLDTVEIIPKRKCWADENVKIVLTVLDKQNNYCLNRNRKVFEDTETGRNVVAGHPDRHLYSVLRPTRSENLTRIENVLRAMSPAALRRVGENARKTMRIYS
jgi:hypothetical protein